MYYRFISLLYVLILGFIFAAVLPVAAQQPQPPTTQAKHCYMDMTCKEGPGDLPVNHNFACGALNTPPQPCNLNNHQQACTSDEDCYVKACDGGACKKFNLPEGGSKPRCQVDEDCFHLDCQPPAGGTGSTCAKINSTNGESDHCSTDNNSRSCNLVECRNSNGSRIGNPLSTDICGYCSTDGCAGKPAGSSCQSPTGNSGACQYMNITSSGPKVVEAAERVMCSMAWWNQGAYDGPCGAFCACAARETCVSSCSEDDSNCGDGNRGDSSSTMLVAVGSICDIGEFEPNRSIYGAGSSSNSGSGDFQAE